MGSAIRDNMTWLNIQMKSVAQLKTHYTNHLLSCFECRFEFFSDFPPCLNPIDYCDGFMVYTLADDRDDLFFIDFLLFI